ncbi:MAG: thiamine-phosphate kinase [Brevinema sp.]
MSKKRMSESNIIEELQILFETYHDDCVGIGDDAAVIDHQVLVSTDAIVEGVHFLQEKASWDDVAYKLFASNASDMVAMGGYPKSYTLALSLPEYWKDNDLTNFIAGMRRFLNEFPADLIGGDLVKSKEFFASVTVLGKPYHRPILRSTAKVGDYIYCTGTLGDSRLWLRKELGQKTLPMKNQEYFKKRHYNPTPRIQWMSTLSKFYITSAMDISDGLIEDLLKLCKASKVSFSLDASLIPMSIDEIGEDNFMEHFLFYQKEALISGEDYEILFTSPDKIDEEVLFQKGIQVTKIGRITAQTLRSTVFWNNKPTAVEEFLGFKH